MPGGSTMLAKAVKSAGGERAFHQKFQQYEASLSYVEQNKEKLLKKFDDNWIAVYNSKVVGYDKNYKGLEKKLKKEKLPIEVVAIKFLSSRKMLTLF